MRHLVTLLIAAIAAVLLSCLSGPPAHADPWIRVTPKPVPQRAVAVVSPAPGRLDLFTRHPHDGTLAHIGWTGPGGWTSWDAIEGARLNVDSEVVAIRRSPWVVDVFARSTDDHVVTATWSRAKGWSAWSVLPGTISAGPGAALKSDGTFAVAAVSHATPASSQQPGTAAVPIVTSWNPTTKATGSWTRVPGTTYASTGPALAFRPNGNLDLFVTNANRNLAVATRSTSGSWSGWNVNTSRVFTSGPATSNQSPDQSGVNLGFRGQNGQLVNVWSPNTGALGIEELGGVLADAATPGGCWWYLDEAGGAPRFDAFVIGGDLGIYQRVWTGASGGWSADFNGPVKAGSSSFLMPPRPALEQAPTSPLSLAVVSPADGRYDFFARSPNDGELLTRWKVGDSYKSWHSLGLVLSAGSEVSAVAGDGRIDVFARDTSDQLRTRAWTSAAGWEPTWRTVGGGTIDAGPNATAGKNGLINIGVANNSVGSIRTWDPVAKTTGNLTGVGAITTWSHTAPAAITRADNVVDVFVTAPNSGTAPGEGGRGRLLLSRMVSGVWTSTVVSTEATSSPALAPERGQSPGVHFVVRGANAQVLMGYSVAPGVNSGAHYIGGSTPIGSRPAAQWWRPPGAPADRFDVYALNGSGSEIVRKSYDNGWGGWEKPFDAFPRARPSNERLPLARRSDTSMRSHLNPNPNNGGLLTPATKAEMENRWSVYASHDVPDSESFLSQAINTWSPVDSHVYWNASGVRRWDGGRASQAQAQGLLIPARNPTAAEPYARIDSWWALDVRKEAARRWWLYGADGVASCTGDGASVNYRAALDYIACGYDGLWLDNVVLSLGHYNHPANVWNVAMPESVTEADWNAGMSQMLRDLRAALPVGVKYTVNIKWSDGGFDTGSPVPSLDPRSPLGRELAAASQVIIEDGATYDPGHRNDVIEEHGSLLRQMAWADAIHSVGGRVQWEITHSTDDRGSSECQGGSQGDGYVPWTLNSARGQSHAEVAKFNYATALMAYVPGDTIGDMCEYPGTSWPGYELVKGLGRPEIVRREYQEPAGSQAPRFIDRSFSGGYVVINQGRRGEKADTTITEYGTMGNREIDLDPNGPPIWSHMTSPRTAYIFKEPKERSTPIL